VVVPEEKKGKTLPPHSSAPIVRLKNVTKTYRMGEVDVRVLRGIDAEINPGEITVILGASGSGKSTLLNLIGGVDRVTSGEVWFKNDNVSSYSESRLTLYRRRNVGFVFQFYNLIPSLTARENVDVVGVLVENPIPSLEALDLVEMKDRADHFPAQLSGGQQQRVSMARALAKRPQLLLCDEPTGALDREMSIRVLTKLQDLNLRLKTTIVMITHAPAIAEMANCVLHLEDGKITRADRGRKPRRATDLKW